MKQQFWALVAIVGFMLMCVASGLPAHAATGPLTAISNPTDHAFAANALGHAISEHAWLENFLLTTHIVSFVVLVGGACVVDLRLLGLGRRIPVRDLNNFVIPIVLASVVTAVSSGLWLFGAHADILIGRPAFLYKMLLLFAAAINALIFYTGPYQSVAKWNRDDRPPQGAQIAGLVSLLIWIAVIFCGQRIAHH